MYTYAYPHPAVATDICVFRHAEDAISLHQLATAQALLPPGTSATETHAMAQALAIPISMAP